MTSDKTIEVKKQTAEDFAQEYKALCEKTGFNIVVSPVWIARDDGTFSMQLQYTVGAMPKK